MNQEQLKQESWEDFWVETFTGSQLIDGKWYEPKFGCDSLQLTIDYYEAQQRVTRQEERARIESLITSEKFSDPCGRDMIDSAYQDGWNDCIKLILNQDQND